VSRVVQIAQHADDLDRASAFYERLLGQPAAARFDPPGLLFFDVGGIRLLLDKSAPPALVYLGVDDVHQRVAELRQGGVVIESEPHLIFTHDDDALGPAGNEEWMAFVRDSESNLVGLVSYAQK
jgi:methylmalonyl-CoA/ethylmalonyl-CoA epimerase